MKSLKEVLDSLPPSRYKSVRQNVLEKEWNYIVENGIQIDYNEYSVGEKNYKQYYFKMKNGYVYMLEQVDEIKLTVDLIYT